MEPHVILCFGDSNTWGFNPTTKDRYPRHQRWTGILAQILGTGYYVLEEGLNSRTTVLDDPITPGRNGQSYLIPCLESHYPLDLVILMLGTNDQKCRFSLSAHDIALGMTSVINVIQRSQCGSQGTTPAVLLMSPPLIGPLTEYAEIFEGAPSKSRQLSQHYRRVAEENGCFFLDVADIVSTSHQDGVHLELSEHQKLGTVVAEQVKQIFASEGKRPRKS